MSQAVLEILPWAIFVSFSPLAMTAVILMLMTPRAMSNAMAMVVGWILSLALIVIIADFIVMAGGHYARGKENATLVTLRLVLGCLLLLGGFLASRRLKRRQGKVSQPRWIGKIDSITPRGAFVLGVSLADVKNLIMAFAAVSGIVYSSHRTLDNVAVLAVFVLVGSLGVVWPLGLYVLKGEQVKASLARSRDWLLANNAKIMVILLFVFGAALLAQGIYGLVT